MEKLAERGDISSSSSDIIQLLVGTSADVVDSRDEEGSTALMYAAQNRHLEVVKPLFIARVKTDVQTLYVATALGYARAYQHTAVIQLLESAASRKPRKQGRTAIMKRPSLLFRTVQVRYLRLYTDPDE